MDSASPFVFDPVPARCRACGADPETRRHLLWPCLPVASYGDVREAQAISLGLNPSDNLFYRRGTREAHPEARRLPMLQDFGVAERPALADRAVRQTVARQRRYFRDFPQRHPWFQRWEVLLQAAHREWTYESGAVAHLDLACCATDQWNQLVPTVRSTLVQTCRPHFLAALRQARRSPWLLLNGRTVLEELATHLEATDSGRLAHAGQAVSWQMGGFHLGDHRLPYLAWNQFLTRVKPELRQALGRLIAERSGATA